MNSIREWLNGSRNYRLGVILYNIHGSDAKLKTMFAQGHSDHRQRRLVAELDQLLSSRPATPIPDAPKVAPAAKKQEPAPAAAPAKDKWQDDPYEEQWKPLFAKMNLLRHRLVTAETDAIRGEMAFEIISLEQQCKAYWRLREHYHRTGIINQPNAEVKERPVVNVNDLQRKLNNMRTYVARYKKLHEQHPDSLRYKNLLISYIAKRDEIEKVLGYARENAPQ